MLVNKTGSPRTIEDEMHETLSRAREILHPRPVSVDELEILPSRPLQSYASYKEELAALNKEREDNKWLILQGRYDFLEKGKRMQFLMKKLAGPIPDEAPRPILRGDRVIKTGFEDSPKIGSRQ